MYKGKSMAKILLIDDQPHMGELMASLFLQEGHVVSCVANREGARKCLKDSDLDLVLLDLYLDGFEGWDLLTHIKTVKPDLPVIIVTAYDSYKEDPRVSLADGYVVKSFSNLDRLKQKISHVLEAQNG